MAATQYQIFCRYYHSTVNRAVLNETEYHWVPSDKVREGVPELGVPKRDPNCYGPVNNPNGSNTNPAGSHINTATKTCEENLWIRCEDWLQNTGDTRTYSGSPVSANEKNRRNLTKLARKLDSDLSTIAISEASIGNPKFDMVFVYEGIEGVQGKEPQNMDYYGGTSASSVPLAISADATPTLVYYEKMARFIMSPWFVYATGSSLKWALTKAEDLVKIIGVENVIIGKVVDLAQYIEIV